MSGVHGAMPAPGSKALSSTPLPCIALAALAIALYLPSLGNGFIHLDDPLYVTDNPFVRSGLTWEGVRWAFSWHTGNYWHPLTWLSLMLDSQVWGTAPLGYHLDNVLLHAATVVLFFLLLRSATGRTLPSLLAAALLAAHPIHVEAVAWVPSRKDVLSSALFLGSALAFVRAVHTGRRSPLAWSVALAILAGLAKPATLTLPFVLLLLDYWPLRRWEETEGPRAWLGQGLRLAREKMPFFAASGLLLVTGVLSHPLISAGSVPVWLRLANILTAYAAYLRKLIWPTDLAIWYSFPLSVQILPLLAALGLLLVLTAAALLARRRFPALPVGWLWFLGCLTPMSGLVQLGMWPALADRFAYLPCMGLYLALAFTAAELATRPLPRYALAAASLAALAVLSGATTQQISYWSNTETLYRRAIAVAPVNWLVQGLLANELIAQGRLPEAEDAARQAIRENPANPAGWVHLARALSLQGHTPEALATLRACADLNPGHPMAQANLAQALLEAGQLDQAEATARQAVRLDPTSPDAHLVLGDVRMAKGDAETARQEYAAALDSNPYSREGRSRLAAALYRLGRFEPALDAFRDSRRLDPGNPDLLVGEASCLAALERKQEALATLRLALAQQPSSALTWNNLGVLLARLGHLDLAAQALEKALAIDPGLDRARASLDKVRRERAEASSKPPP